MYSVLLRFRWLYTQGKLSIESSVDIGRNWKTNQNCMFGFTLKSLVKLGRYDRFRSCIRAMRNKIHRFGATKKLIFWENNLKQQETSV